MLVFLTMKIPKARNRYCPTCKKHTPHKVTEAKKKTFGTAHPHSHANKLRLKARGRMGVGNHGRISRKPVGQRKMSGKKMSKKTDFRYECTVCKKMHTQNQGMRAKKVEFV